MALRKILGGVVALGAIGVAAFVFLTAPERLPADTRLRALVRDWLLAGRHLSVGGALLPLADWQRFGQTPYFREEDLAAFRKLAGAENPNEI